MTIAIGDRIPDVELRTMVRKTPEALRSRDVLGKGKVVLFAVPGAFTPTCSDYHLPGFVHRADELLAKGRGHHRVHVGQRPLRHGGVGRESEGGGARSSCWPTATASSPGPWASRST